MPNKKVKITVEGCGHGELSAIYSAIPKDTQLLIICGDFQALRNETDLQGISVPSKYKRLGDFHKYYKGEIKAPVLTLFIGGNHESSSYLTELKFGGWVAPNIYYLGEFGAIWFKGIKIGGISGIFNSYSFSRNKTQDEDLPYTDKTIRSVYHVSPKIFTKMYLMDDNLDIALSHDWPSQIEKHGDLKLLLKKKPFFKNDIATNKLGSPLNKILMEKLKPRYWFSAHLHVKFRAVLYYNKRKGMLKNSDNSNPDEIKLNMDDDFELETKKNNDNNNNPDEIELNMDDDFELEKKENNNNTRRCILESKSDNRLSKRIKLNEKTQTQFLALDKCLPGRAFLESLEVPVFSDHPSVYADGLYYDKRTIAINKVIESFIVSKKDAWLQMSSKELYNPETCSHYKIISNSIELEEKKLLDSDMNVPNNFKVVCPTSDTETNKELKYWANNQTSEYCEKFNILYTLPA